MTLVELYDRTLQKLTVTASGEPGDPADIQVVAGWYTSLYDMLLTKGLAAWGATADVPAYAVIPLVSMLAYASARDFGKDPMQYMAEGALDLSPPSIGERQLRGQLAKPYISHTQPTEYF